MNCFNNCGNDSCLYLILILMLCGGSGNSCGCDHNNGCGGNMGGCSPILLILLLCGGLGGNGGGCGNSCGNSCGCCK